MKKKRIRLGTRGSDLALAQTNQVMAAIQKEFPEAEIERIILRTQGDKILDKPLLDFGGKGVFVSEFEAALREKRIDLAVHSAKDMPMELGDGLVIAGALPRADARDVLVIRKGGLSSILSSEQIGIPTNEVNKNMKQGNTGGLNRDFVVGTGSLRRQFQIEKLYPKVICKSVRGNVPTRLQKLRDGEYDGVILAAAGLGRLELLEEEDLEYRFFSYDEMIPAGGQGIIAIEGRKGDQTAAMVQEISDGTAYDELMTERKALEILNAGCHEAIGIISQYHEGSVRIRLIREVDGQVFRQDETAGEKDGLALAARMAESVRNGGS